MSDDKKLGRPEVDPMSTAAWSRVERGLFERLDLPHAAPEPRRARWPLFALPAVAAAAALIIVLAARGTTQRVIVDEPSRVVAGETSSEVTFADAHLTLAPHTAIVMAREDAGPSIVIDRGRTELVVAPRGDRPPFVVRAADVVVRVVGTQFAVARSDERVVVEVTHGIVDVQYRAKVQRLRAGESWSTDTPDKVTQTVIALPSPAPTPRQADLAPAQVVPAPTPTHIPPTHIPPTPTQVAPAGPRVDPRETYEKLSALERRAPSAALTGYLALSTGNSAWAPVALYAAGRLAMDLGDPRARTFLETYLRRFPRGANADDARNLLNRLPGAN